MQHEIDLLKLIGEEDTGHGFVKIHDIFEDTQKVFIVMECVNHGHLYQWIKDNQ